MNPLLNTHLQRVTPLTIERLSLDYEFSGRGWETVGTESHLVHDSPVAFCKHQIIFYGIQKPPYKDSFCHIFDTRSGLWARITDKAGWTCAKLNSHSVAVEHGGLL